MDKKTCCVTGHRDIAEEQTEFVKNFLLNEIERAIDDGFTCFLSGFADGVYQYFAEIVAEKIEENIPIELAAVIPYKKRVESLKKKDRTKALIKMCSDVVIIEDEYLPSVYSKRNRYMVERSDRVIAVYDGREKGGTFDAVQAANKLKKEIVKL